MTLLVKDANTTVQSLATEVDGNGNLVPVHAPATTNAPPAAGAAPAVKSKEGSSSGAPAGEK